MVLYMHFILQDAFSCMNSSIVTNCTAGGSWKGYLFVSLFYLYSAYNYQPFANFSDGKNPLSLIYHEKVAKHEIRVMRPEISFIYIYTVWFSTVTGMKLESSYLPQSLCKEHIYIRYFTTSKKLDIGYVSQMLPLSIW